MLMLVYRPTMEFTAVGILYDHYKS